MRGVEVPLLLSNGMLLEARALSLPGPKQALELGPGRKVAIGIVEARDEIHPGGRERHKHPADGAEDARRDVPGDRMPPRTPLVVVGFALAQERRVLGEVVVVMVLLVVCRLRRLRQLREGLHAGCF